MFKVLFLPIFIFFLFPVAFGEQDFIPITASPDREKIIYDGIWTFTYEWKRSTLTDLRYEDNFQLILRSAHQGDYMYFLVDAPRDLQNNKSADFAIICIDAGNEKSKVPDHNDYCFGSGLNNNNGFMLQGEGKSKLSSNFQKISNHEEFIAVSSISNFTYPHSKPLHPSFEFKIPIELFGRSNNYGFYFTMFESNSNQFYSWPQYVDPQKPLRIPSPQNWGNLISPDKSLPEFGYPLLIVISTFLAMIFFFKKFSPNIVKIKN